MLSADVARATARRVMEARRWLIPESVVAATVVAAPVSRPLATVLIPSMDYIQAVQWTAA